MKINFRVPKNGKICPPTVAMSTIYLMENPPPKAYKTDKQRDLMQFLFPVPVQTDIFPKRPFNRFKITHLLIGAWKGIRYRSDEHSQKSQFLLPNLNILLINRNKKGEKPSARKFPIFLLVISCDYFKHFFQPRSGSNGWNLEEGKGAISFFLQTILTKIWNLIF